MVKHILADGRQVDSVSGVVIRIDEFPELCCLFQLNKKGETHGVSGNVRRHDRRDVAGV